MGGRRCKRTGGTWTVTALAILAVSCGGSSAERQRPARGGEEPVAVVEDDLAREPVEAPGAAPEQATAPRAHHGHVLEGMATWYGPGFTGRRTASGERFDPGRLTAAHRTLPFGTRVRVVALASGASVVVRINDRGPFGHGDRIIDLSRGAARRIGLDRAGVMRVRLEVLGN